jgi:hypothetical protein
VYALGCTVYFLLTGRTVYEGRTVLDKLLAHREHPVPCLQDARADVPLALDIVIRRMLAKRPADRFKTMDEVIQALERTRQKTRRLPWIVLGLVLICLVVLVWFVLPSRPKKPTGTLVLQIEPAGSQAEIDGITVNAPEAQVSPGEHQVTVRKEGYESFVAEVRVKENEAKLIKVRLVPDWPGEWVPLFNGRDLTGWKAVTGNPAEEWQVADGILSGRKPERRLFSERGDYQDFRFRIEARVSDRGIAGQGFRVKFGRSSKRFTDGYYVQSQSNFVAAHRTGSLFRTRDDHWAGELCQMVDEMVAGPDEWFNQEIVAIGNRIVVRVNGKQVVDFEDTRKAFDRGHFTLHSGDVSGPSIQYRKVEVKEQGRRFGRAD